MAEAVLVSRSTEDTPGPPPTWPPLFAGAIYLALVLLGLAAAGGPFTYPLDDAYIHLALSRTLATTGVWGVQPQDAAAASSSPLWTLILAGLYRLFPVALRPPMLWAPLLLNLAAGFGVIGLWDLLLRRYGGRLGGGARLVLLLAGVTLTGLPQLSLIGMEHGLHIALATLLVWLSAEAIADTRQDRTLLLSLVCALAVATRYETLFVLPPLVALGLLRRRFSPAAALVLGACLPVIGFGLYWKAHGGWMLPNSLLLKAAAPGANFNAGAWISSIAHNVWNNVRQGPSTLAVLGASAVVLALLAASIRRHRTLMRPQILFALATLSAVGVQYALASVNWLYRYEAWLVSLALTSIGLLYGADFSNGPATKSASRPWPIMGLVILILSCGVRSALSAVTTLEAIDDRREEHRPPAELVRRFYAGETIVANDLGMLAYFGDARILDLYGLGENEPIRLRRQPGGYGEAQLARWAVDQKAPIAILQICWPEASRRVPRDWPLVEVWRIPRNVVFGDRDIGFFATRPDQIGRLEAALRQTPPPSRVEVHHPTAEAWAAYLAAARNGRPTPMGNGLCQ